MKTYQYRMCRESLLSRIPGLFPYIDYNTFGAAVLHKATDNSLGCYCKIAQNMKLPSDVSLTIGDNIILYGGNEYSYRTLIDYYYKYVDELDDDDTFKSFIETAIGKIKITDQEWYDEKEHDLVPEYMYLATAKTLYKWFVRRKALCEQYENMEEDGAHTDCASYYCCKCEEYERMGGDNMLNLLKSLMQDAEEIADKYYDYACDIDSLTLNMHINLTNSIKDNGVMSPMELYWIAGDEYKRGDIVVYDNESYICTVNKNGSTTGKYNGITEKIEFDSDNFTKIKDLSSNDANADEFNISDAIDSTDGYSDKFRITEQQYYINGKLVQKWEEETSYSEGDYILYNNIVYICNTEHISEYSFNESYFDKTDDYTVTYTDKTNDDIEFDGMTNSKLKSLRRYRDYINEYDEIETPSIGEDWLYYYRTGVANYTVSNDNMGNMNFIYDIADEWQSNTAYSVGTMAWYNGELYECTEKTSGDGYFNFTKFNKKYKYTNSDGDDVAEGEYCYNLYAYGDVMTDIGYLLCDDGRYKLIFEYVIGAHLKAVYKGYETDDDKNEIHYFAGFEYDETDVYHGVKHVDEYYIDTDSDIYTKLIATGKFSDYITDTDTFDTIKYEFDTSGSSISENKLINNNRVYYPTIMSDFYATVKNEVDYSYSPMLKIDYLNSISYAPSKNVDVNITRGNAAAFDRHIKLGEIKTMEDLENYANGGFYNIQENS